MPRRNVLIFHAGALGDFIVTWPIALALARIFPQSRIYYVTQRGKGLLAEKVLRIESSDADVGWHQLFSESPALGDPAARLLDGAHTIVSFISSGNDRWGKNIRRLAPEAKLVSINTLTPANFSGHLTQWMVDQLADWPAGHAAVKQILHGLQTRGITAVRGAMGPIIIHPGAGSPSKCWPAEHFLALARRLRDAEHQVRVLLGEVEAERWPAEEVEQFKNVCEIAYPSTYIELLDQLAGAALFIGNDSGPGHLAGIIGTPTVSLFASPDPQRWSPLGPSVRVLCQAAGGLSVDEVFATAMEMRRKS